MVRGILNQSVPHVEDTKSGDWHTITRRIKSIPMGDKIKTSAGVVCKCVPNVPIFVFVKKATGREWSKELDDRNIVLNATDCQQSTNRDVAECQRLLTAKPGHEAMAGFPRPYVLSLPVDWPSSR